jgi:hypothetical protein
MTKPFDLPAEGVVSENSQGDGTTIELFLRFCTEIKNFG